VSAVAVFDLRQAPEHPGEISMFNHQSDTRTTIPGCVEIKPARRW
jgi:hypothetical protein